MQLRVASGNKRKNSTKQLSPAAAFDVYLKNGCSMIDPIFILSLDTESFPKWAEVYFDDRYYFVNDIVNTRDNLFEIHCHVDVLATWKSLIINTPAYVEYYDHTQTEIVDNRLGIKTTATRSENRTPISNLNPSTGTYVVNLTGETSSGAFKVSSYNDIVELLPLWSDVFTDIRANWGSDFLENIALTFCNLCYSGDVAKNLKDAWWTPWVLSGDGAVGGSNLYCGQYRTAVAGQKLEGITFIPDVTVNIPWQFGDWRDASPYTELYLFVPLVGVIPISPSDVKGLSTITVRYVVAKVDGTFTIFVRAGDKCIYTTSGDSASHFIIGRGGAVTSSVLGSAVSIGTSAIGAVATGGASAAIGAAAASSFSAVSQMGSTGGNLTGASATGGGTDVIMYSICHDTATPIHGSRGVIGEPYLGQMSTMPSGFVQTRGFSVKADAITSGAITMQEIEEINSLMDNGVFIE